MKIIHLLIIEDNRLLRDRIAVMLKKQKDINLVAALGEGENLLKIIAKLKFADVLLLDLGLRSKNSLEIVRAVKWNFEKTKVIIMDLIPSQADILQFIQAGVSGFILKDAKVNELLNTIRLVSQGSQILPPHLTDSLFSQIVKLSLNEAEPLKLIESIHMTKRERQVIELIASGLTNKEIAQKIHLSPFTVKSHVHNILEKLKLHTRIHIAKYANNSENYNNSIKSISSIEE